MKNRLINLLIVVLYCTILRADGLKLWYRHPAKVWTEASPLGNSHLGAMVYGGVVNEEIQLNEETVWGGGPYRNDSPKAFGVLAKVRELIFAGQEKEAEKLMADNFFTGQHGMPFQTIGSLMLKFGEQTDYSDYRRELDLKKAIVSIRYKIGNVNYTRTLFTSLADNALIMRIEANKPGSVNFVARYNTPYKEYTIKKNKKCLLLSGRGSAHEGIPGAIRFETRTHIKAESGKVIVKDDCIEVKNADAAVVYVTAATNFVNYKDVSGNETHRTRELMAKAVKLSYAKQMAAHEAVYQKYFNRVSLNIGSSSEEDTPYRIRHFKEGKDLGLVALIFQFGRYLLISSSQPGGQPAGLQGIWNKELLAPWDGKYTININTEMNYWPAEVTNLSEMHQPLFQMVEELSETAQGTARTLYNCRGWVVHHNTDIWRMAGPVDGASYVWPLGGAWLSQHLWQHYLYTGDQDFLKSAYPALKGAADFFLDYLVPHPKYGWMV